MITVTGNFKEASKALSTTLQQKMHDAAMAALNAAGYAGMKAGKSEMERVFDRPTPWIKKELRFTQAGLDLEGKTPAELAKLRNIQGRPAKHKSESITIGFSWDGNKQGVTAEDVLMAEIYGGPRKLKRFESALQRIGVLPRGMFIVPGPAARIDAYGNMAVGQINQILSWFDAFGEQGYRANKYDKGRRRARKTTKKTRGYEYFAVLRTEGGLRPGVYQRIPFAWGNAIRPIMYFVRQPVYSRRFDFHDVVSRAAVARFRSTYPRMLDAALKTARW